MYVCPNLPFQPTPHSLPLVNLSLFFYICDSISVLQIDSSVLFFLIPHISDIIWYLSLSDFYRSMHVATNDIISFLLWLSNIQLIIYETDFRKLSQLFHHVDIEPYVNEEVGIRSDGALISYFPAFRTVTNNVSCLRHPVWYFESTDSMLFLTSWKRVNKGIFINLFSLQQVYYKA